PLEPFEAVAVDADIAEQMGGELLVRIKAPALLDEADAVEIQRGNAARFIRRDLPPHVREVTLVLQAIGQRLAIAPGAVAEGLAQLRDRLAVVVDFRWHGVDRIDV